MVSPKEEKKSIYKRLDEIYRIINPNRGMFMFDLTHPLCPEREYLIGVYHEYLAYERWFKKRAQ